MSFMSFRGEFFGKLFSINLNKYKPIIQMLWIFPVISIVINPIKYHPAQVINESFTIIKEFEGFVDSFFRV